MNLSFTVAHFLAAAVALLLAPTGHGFFLGPLLSLTLLPYTIVYNLSGIAGVKIALCLKLLGLLAWWRAGISDETMRREVDLRALELPTGALFPGMPNLPLHMAPGIVAEIVRSMLQDDNVGAGFFQRSATEMPPTDEEPPALWDRGHGSPYGDFANAGGWPARGVAFPAQTVYGGFNYPFLAAAAAATGFDKLKRSADTPTQLAMPPRGWFRQPRGGQHTGRATVGDVFGYTLEMIQDMDADDCMLKLSCEVGADPTVYGSYGRRLSGFIRELRSLGGSESKLRRYQDAFEAGRRRFPGDRNRCGPAYASCQYDMQKITDFVI